MATKSSTQFNILKTMCAIQAPSGNEVPMTEFVLNYIGCMFKKGWSVNEKNVLVE